MEYRFAKPDDLEKWLEVADDVGEIMRVPNMRNDAHFLEYAKRKLEQNDAIMAYDGDNKKCAGFVGFSRHNNNITWLGVVKEYRNQGVGSTLLSAALKELDPNKKIAVNTYPSDYLPGQPARKLYFKHGFVETTGEMFVHDGLEMVELSIMTDKPYYTAYESRYKKVYEAGGDTWGHTPNDEELIEYLTEWVNKYSLKGKKIIEFACGEGASGVILSKLGCIYHGIDIAPSAVEKAKDLLIDFPDASVSLLDMVNQPIEGLYDAALDVAGFHMLVTDPDRMNYLKNAFSCLKNNAPMFFFRELYSQDADDGYIGTFDEWLAITKNDYTATRKMFLSKDGKDIEIHLPYVPGRSKSKDGYTRELTETGFIVDSIVEMPPSHKTPDSVSIYVSKP